VIYTDSVLASAIERLQAHAGAVDSALVFVSDHGESLGESGLFLHGMPYAVAPELQKHVPMIFWASNGFERAAGLARGCLLPEMQRRAPGKVAHDHLFHTVLGLLDIHTALYESEFDLGATCRSEAMNEIQMQSAGVPAASALGTTR
jgi:lipid A ethanolaminephosphotransferase